MYSSFLVLLVAVFIGRFIQITAFRNLSDKDKVKVMSENIMQLSQMSLVIIMGMVFVFYILLNQYPFQYKPISIIFSGAILTLRIITYTIERKNMITNDVPQEYINKYFVSWLIITIGIIAFVMLSISQFIVKA
jgi:hypothetical protein